MRLRSILVSALACAALPAAASAAAIDFTDDFTGGPSAHWSSYTGDWYGHDGVYEARFPSNSPTTLASLDFDLIGALTFEADVNDLADGGLWINTDGTNQNGVLLVLGGDGYGPSGGAFGGTAIYWHTVSGGAFSGALNHVAGVFTPGDDHHIRVTYSGGVYEAFVDGVSRTTLNYGALTGGRVGLYDEWGPMTFDNVHLVGQVAVPEPAAWTLMIGGFGFAGAALRRRRAVAA